MVPGGRSGRPRTVPDPYPLLVPDPIEPDQTPVPIDTTRLTTEQVADIATQRAVQVPTRRATSEAMEQLLFQPVPVLDQGFVRVVDYMGDDHAIVQAARVSYGAGTRTVRSDAGLIDYLMRHQHTSPFEMCELKLHVKLPVFVARQWIRHRTASVNEYSGRYSEIADTFYDPAPDAIGRQSATNRQGSTGAVSAEVADAARTRWREDADCAYQHYRDLLDAGDEAVAREVARIGLPLSHYTEWYWKVDLHNLLRFLELRMDRHAQHEIRAYATAIGSIVAAWVPATWASFTAHRLDALRISGRARTVISAALEGQPLALGEAGLSTGEARELREALGLEPDA
ncbi:MAG: FAD-dependent thymidylate synthase [Chloroflexi bacterium]|nr:FAD-dependent thymidylate synthase [Chloroflexota bacterium]